MSDFAADIRKLIFEAFAAGQESGFRACASALMKVRAHYLAEGVAPDIANAIVVAQLEKVVSGKFDFPKMEMPEWLANKS